MRVYEHKISIEAKKRYKRVTYRMNTVDKAIAMHTLSVYR